MNSTISINDWQSFCRNVWQKSPEVLGSLDLGAPKEVFDALVIACDAYRSGNFDGLLKLYVNGQRIEDEIGRHLPNSEDGSIKHYEHRLQQTLDAETFTLFLSGLQPHSRTLNLRMSQIADTITHHTGTTFDHADLEIFLGKYSLTPGGIHKEECTNFHSVIQGRKLLYVWNEDYFDTKTISATKGIDPGTGAKEVFLEAVSPVDHLTGCRILEGTDGSVFYWPTGHWHVGEAPELSLCLNIALYPTRSCL